jgi:hypothetical protein
MPFRFASDSDLTAFGIRPEAGGPVAGTIFFVRVLVRVIVIEQAV